MHSRKSSPRVQRTKIHKLEVHCKGSWVHSIYRFALHISQFWMLWCFFTFNLLFWVDPQSKSQNSGKLMKMIGHTCVAYNTPWQSKLQGPSRWYQSYHNTSWYRLSSFTMKRLVSSFNTNHQNKAFIIISWWHADFLQAILNSNEDLIPEARLFADSWAIPYGGLSHEWRRLNMGGTNKNICKHNNYIVI